MTDHTPSGLPQPQSVAALIALALKCGAFQNEGRHGIPAGTLITFEPDELEAFAAALSAPAVETVAVQEAIADERKSWADASAHDKEIASLALDCLAHRLTCRTPLPAAPKAAPDKWIFDPHDIEQGMMLNPEWLKLHGLTAKEAAQADSAVAPKAEPTKEVELFSTKDCPCPNGPADPLCCAKMRILAAPLTDSAQPVADRSAEPVALSTLTDADYNEAMARVLASEKRGSPAVQLSVALLRRIIAAASAPALQAPTHERAAPAPEPAEEYSLSWIEHEAESLSRSQPVAAEGVKDEVPRRMTMEEFERDDHGYSGDCA